MQSKPRLSQSNSIFGLAESPTDFGLNYYGGIFLMKASSKDLEDLTRIQDIIHVLTFCLIIEPWTAHPSWTVNG